MEDCANSSYVPAPVVNSEVSGGSDGRVLMLAFTPQGFKALAIPNGCIVDLMPPIQPHDDNAIKHLFGQNEYDKVDADVAQFGCARLWGWDVQRGFGKGNV